MSKMRFYSPTSWRSGPTGKPFTGGEPPGEGSTSLSKGQNCSKVGRVLWGNSHTVWLKNAKMWSVGIMWGGLISNVSWNDKQLSFKNTENAAVEARWQVPNEMVKTVNWQLPMKMTMVKVAIYKVRENRFWGVMGARVVFTCIAYFSYFAFVGYFACVVYFSKGHMGMLSSLKPRFGNLTGERETGDGRRETGDGRRETGDGRRETGDGRRETGDGRRETGDGRRETGDGRRETGDGRRETGDGRRETGDGRRETGDGRREDGGQGKWSDRCSQEALGMELMKLTNSLFSLQWTQT
ncbi:hypothetical protein F4604DRAFT_1688196 [Suillus subluteus]|nr:hypothetical protein F4604DRAFT_1688196 [Suillus subluteus]